ncbi:hypothetical protein [Dyella flagellata]|uniref:Protein activator of alkane oxidation PraB n=1 Tax=Dyella flagellata TaxID=1867833 RepID=A0ABQ5X9X6_9GAMM|nr:hypothetical protein [Dyella flagellata]GLQ88044.1 hypothetical protein GCM10007898_16130 [Dyella flagellata]
MFVIKTLLQGSALAVGVVLAAPVFAAHAVPFNTTFTATGPTTMTQSGLHIPCNSSFVLVTDGSGDVTVTQATFSGGSPMCNVITASGLPWPVSLNSTTAAVIHNVTVRSPLGTCSGNVDATINNSNSQIFLDGRFGTCAVTGYLSVTPQFKVVD